MNDLFYISLLMSVIGSLSCWNKWEDIRKYSSQPEPYKTQLFMIFGSTITFIFMLIVLFVSGNAKF